MYTNQYHNKQDSSIKPLCDLTYCWEAPQLSPLKNTIQSQREV